MTQKGYINVEQNLAKQTLKTLSLAGYGLGECTSDILIPGNASESSELHSIPLKIEIGENTHEHNFRLRIAADPSGQVTAYGRLTAQCYCGKVLTREQITTLLNTILNGNFIGNSARKSILY